MLESHWVLILSVVWLLATAAGISILALGVPRGGGAAQRLAMGLRWLVIAWLSVMAAGEFANLVLAMFDFGVARRIYLSRSGAVGESLADIAGYLALDAALVAGLVILALGVWRGSRWTQKLEGLAVRWVVIAWLLVMAAGYFVNMALAMTYDYWAGLMYLRRPRPVDVTLAEIAGHLAIDAAWGAGLVILAFGLWRWSRVGQWAVGALLVWLMFSRIWGLVTFAIRWQEFFGRMNLEWSSLWIWPGQMLLMRGGELLLIALMLLWLVQPRVRARFAESGAVRAAV
jgi:hypothetical protein